MITFGLNWPRTRSALAAAMPCRSSVTTSSGLLISFFTLPPLSSCLSVLLFRYSFFDMSLVGCGRLTSGLQPLIDEGVVHDGADDSADDASHDRDPPVPVDVAVVPR